MRRHSRAGISAMVLGLTLWTGAAAQAGPRFLSARAVAGGGVRLFAISAGTIGRWLATPFRAGRPRDDRRVRSESGWQALSFRLDDDGAGVYLSVRGSVEFESARVTYDDGGEEPFALHGAVRADGLFAL